MNQKTRVVVKLTLGLALAIVFDTVQQLAWKMGIGAAGEAPSPIETVGTLLHEPLFGLVVVLMILRMINWLKVLELADLSFAQPITALSYVTVTVASAILLHEKLTLLHISGVVMIVAGVWCISQTRFVSPLSKAPTP
ncbi:MAG: EamA family transporter [Xanthobacteraceae bacterium]